MTKLAFANRSVCDLETIGRRTGKPHTVEIWFAVDPGRDRRIYVLAGGRDQADWVLNVRHNGRVRIGIGERWISGRADVIEGGPDDALARRLLASKYQGWTDGAPLSSWARTSLPVAIDLEIEPAPES